MNTRQMSNDELLLLLHALRSVWVHDYKEAHERLTRQIERELKRRGLELVGAR